MRSSFTRWKDLEDDDPKEWNETHPFYPVWMMAWGDGGLKRRWRMVPDATVVTDARCVLFFLTRPRSPTTQSCTTCWA